MLIKVNWIKNINGYIELLPIQIPLLISIHFFNENHLYSEKKPIHLLFKFLLIKKQQI